MGKASLCTYPSCWVVDEHALQQIDTCFVQGGHAAFQRRAAPLGERGFVVGQTLDAGPDLIAGRAESPEDTEDLVDLRVTGEQRATHRHLGKDTAYAPHVDGRAVVTRTEKDLWSPIPQRDHLMGVGSQWDTESAGQAEIGQLQVALLVDQQILRFEIAMQNSMGVAEVNASDELVSEFL